MSAICLHFGDSIDSCLPEGWSRKRVEFQRRDGRSESRVEIVNADTNIRYLNEPMLTTSIKCFLLALGLFPYGAAYLAFQGMKTASLIIATSVRTVREFGPSSTIEDVACRMSDFVVETLSILYQTAHAVAIAPFYLVAMEISAIAGIFFPLEGRVWFGLVERAWKGAPLDADPWHKGSHDDRDRACTQLWTDRHSPHVFYLAACFQPFGRTTDPHVISVAEAIGT